jgi:branched-chain amino acid transport system substrate-binding protein
MLALFAGASSQASAKTAAKSAIPIGMICSCTGAEASGFVEAPPALKAWVAMTNAHGGINGHPVRVYEFDDQSSPGTSLSDVETLVGTDHIVSLVDYSLEDSSWATYVAQHKVPVVGAILSGGSFSTNPDFFPEGMSYYNIEKAMALVAKDAGLKKIALLYCVESTECSALVAPLKQAMTADGVDMVYTTAINSTLSDYTAECLAAKQAGADGMFVAESSGVVVTVAKSCATQGFAPLQLANDGSIAASFLTAPGMNGMRGVELDIPYFVKNTPATAAMYAALNKYEPGTVQSPNFGDSTTVTWTAAVLFGAAARAGGLGKGGKATSAQVLNGLYKLRGTTLGGLAPPLRYQKGSPADIKCYFTVGIQGNKFILPNGAKTSCVS